MATAWLLTLPAAGVVGAICYWIADGIGGTAGVIVVFAILALASAALYLQARKTPVSHHNVNDEWDGSAAPADSRQDAVAA
jgi:PiT family inorganic phosphate transporter